MPARTLVLAAAATAALVGTATAASATDDPTPAETHVGIFAILAAPGEDFLMKTFMVDDVVVGDGPELTAADLEPGSDDICGDLEVDVDLVANTVSVTGSGEECMVAVTALSVLFYDGYVLEDATLVSDGLFGEADIFQGAEAFEMGFSAAWGDDSWFAEETVEPGPGTMLGGTSVFSLTFGDQLISDWLGEGVGGGDGGSEPVDGGVEAEAEAEAAAPVVATPQFTG